MTPPQPPEPLTQERIKALANWLREVKSDNQAARLKIHEAADALDAALKEREWQPIETAPKDGTPFIVWWPGGYADTMASWREYLGFIGFGEPHATHWQPLPAPPKVTP